MTAADAKRIENIARKSAKLARKSLKKSDELEAYLGLLDCRAGKVREIKSIPATSTNHHITRGIAALPAARISSFASRSFATKTLPQRCCP
jgi:hypothetical protein